MRRPPRKLTDRLIDRSMRVDVVLIAIVMACATLFTLDLKPPARIVDGSAELTEARTAGFTVLVLAQLFNCLNSRAERTSAFFGVFSNRRLWFGDHRLTRRAGGCVVRADAQPGVRDDPADGRRLSAVCRDGQFRPVDERAQEAGQPSRLSRAIETAGTLRDRVMLPAAGSATIGLDTRAPASGRALRHRKGTTDDPDFPRPDDHST